MARDFICGFDCGDLAGHWGTLTGAPVVQTTTKRTGTYALELTPVAAENVSTPTLTASNHRVIAFYFRFSGFPTVAAYYTICNIQATSSGGLQVNNSAVVQGYVGASVQDGPTLVVDTWYRADLYMNTSADPAVLKWKIDGVDQADVSGAQAINNISSFRHGSASQTGSFSLFIDDVVGAAAAADWPLTDGPVKAFSPNGDGTHTTTATNMVKGTTGTPVGAAITSATTDAYLNVDDIPISGTAEFWNFQTASSTTYGEVTFPDSADGAPLAVASLITLSAVSNAGCNQKAVLYDGTTAADIYAAGTIGVTHPTLLYKRTVHTAAPTGAWTEALFNATRVRWGYAVDATPDMYFNGVVLEASFAEPAGNVTVTPTTASLTTATFAPTVTASDHQSVTPGVASLSLTTFAPSVTVGVNVVPTTASLALATFAPTVSTTDNQMVTPSTAALTLATFVPTVTASDHKTVVPDVAALTITTFAPTVTATAHQVVTPDTAALTLTTFAPNVTGGAGLTVVPTTASLALTAFAPNVTATDHQTVTPTTASLSLTAFAPTVTASDHKLVTPTTAALALTTFAPTVTGGEPILIGGASPGVGAAIHSLPTGSASNPRPGS